MKTQKAIRENTSTLLPLEDYDLIVVGYSGGKDSTACVLHLLEQGVPRHKIRLWHHAIDGKPGSANVMDWPITEAYCEAFAHAMGIRLLYGWKEGGFEKEMLRENELTTPISFQSEDGEVRTIGGTRGKLATRRMFPQVSANLSVRWCSAYLKIDVARRSFSNDPFYKTGKFLMVTGERRQESAARATYATVERHSSTNKSRRVDQWRAIIEWSEKEVWAILQRHAVVPHPAYRLGWSRTSCMTCIFGTADQWAAVRELAPERFEQVAKREEEFGKTIQRSKSIRQLANEGTSFLTNDKRLQALGMSKQYTDDIFTSKWNLPAGAFKDQGGPT